MLKLQTYYDLDQLFVFSCLTVQMMQYTSKKECNLRLPMLAWLQTMPVTQLAVPSATLTNLAKISLLNYIGAYQ